MKRLLILAIADLVAKIAEADMLLAEIKKT